MPIWPFLDLQAPEGKSLSDAYLDVYTETYVQAADGSPLQHQDWRGTTICFERRKFGHAFSDSDDYRTHGGHAPELSLERARRVLWIRAVLSGDVSGSNEIYLRRSAVRQDNRGRPVTRQVYLVPAELYIVVLDLRTNGTRRGEWFFHTAYASDATYFHDRAMQEGVQLDVRRGQRKSPSLIGD